MDSRLIPDSFGDYVTLRDKNGVPVVLGSGGFGTTVSAFRPRRIGDAEFRDDFAIKILHHQAIQDPKRRRQFIAEILALRALKHPNLVGFVDCGEKDELIYLVMELCRGGDLERFVSEWGPFTERAALQVILQVCEGLKEAHRKNYLHRDLKPRNILLLESVPPTANLRWFENAMDEGRLSFKVVDFGLAGRLGGEMRISGFAGSPMFCSPEQVKERDLDFRSDIYSLGITLWYLAAGGGPLRRPDGAPVQDSREAMKAHTIPQLHDAFFPETLTPGFRDVLSRMVRKSSDERFKSVRELTDAIRRVLEHSSVIRQPSTYPPDLGQAPLETTIVELPEWGTGACDDFYTQRIEMGRRPVGKFYLATSTQTGKPIGLTAWVPGVSPDAPTEHQLAHHLEQVKRVTCSVYAPASLTPISEIRRTAGEWCVVEDWQDGTPLGELLELKGRSLSFHDIASVLMPVADAADFLLQNKIDSALITLWDIRLCGLGASSDDREWLRQPVDSWISNLSVQVSAVAIPQELAGNSIEIETNDASVSSSRFGDGEDVPHIGKAFCRLFYRMVEGLDVAAAADWDENSYSEANRLSAKSNALLRDAICGATDVSSVSDLLRRICSNEGVFHLPDPPSRNTWIPTASDSAEMTQMETRRGRPRIRPTTQPRPLPTAPAIDPVGAETEEAPPPSTEVEPPPPTEVAPPPPTELAPATPQAAPKPKPISIKAPPVPAPTVVPDPEIAELIPGAVGRVRSPYGSKKEQPISGPEWRNDGRIQCAETKRVFTLPTNLPPLEAVTIPGRFDAVTSPYVEPPQEIPVPVGRWKPEEQITCVHTGLVLKLPGVDLPTPVGTFVSGKPGFVRSPFGIKPELLVPPDKWRPGQKVTCGESGETFVLPSALPPLYASASEVPGCFTSPYDPGKRFTLPPHQCVAGFEFPCPTSGELLAVPPTWPANWLFEGRVRPARPPEAQSPFVNISETDFWQPLAARDWRAGATVRCARTGKDFLLPAVLPCLPVDPAPISPGVLSPFSPHQAIAVPITEWKSGAHLAITLPEGPVCEVELPEGELPPVAVIPGENAGEFTSPYAPDRSFTLPPWACLSGATLNCPYTDRPLIVPAPLPTGWRWEAQIQQTEVPEARSPFVLQEEGAEDSAATEPTDADLLETLAMDEGPWQKLSESEWKPGMALRCKSTGRSFFLPSTLPPLRVTAGEKPPSILSPFSPHGTLPVEPAVWKRSAEITIHLSSGLPCNVILPDNIAPLGRAEPGELPVLPVGLEPQVRAGHGAIRSPHGDQPWIEVAAKEWLSGMRIVCTSTRQAFWLPDDIPPLEARIGQKPGTVYSPYTDRSVEIPPAQWNDGEAVRCADTGGLFVLPKELPPLIGRIDESRPGLIESPFTVGEFAQLTIDEWLPNGAVTCPSTKRSFVLPSKLPEWIVELELINASSGMVRSPYGELPEFKVPGKEWVAGAIVACPPDGRRARLPAKLPPMQATLVDGKPGLIRSPYTGIVTEQKIPRSQWHAGRILPCAATRRPMLLPDMLPPMPKSAAPRLVVLASAVLLVIAVSIGIVAHFLNPEPEVAQNGTGHLESFPETSTTQTAEWPSTYIFLRGIDPPADSVILQSDGTTGIEIKPESKNGLRVELSLAKVIREKKLEGAQALQLTIVKAGYKPSVIPLSRSAESDAFRSETLFLQPETGRLSVRGQEMWPRYSKIEFTRLDAGSSGQKVTSVPFNQQEPVEFQVGNYRVALAASRTPEGIELASWPLGEIKVASTQPIEFKLPAFEIPHVLSGYVRIEWKDSVLKFFRGPDDLQPINEKRNVTFPTWSPVVVTFDANFGKGQFYEAHNGVTSMIVFALDQLIGERPDSQLIIKSNTASILKALNLPKDPKATMVKDSMEQLRKSTDALRSLAQKKIETLEQTDARDFLSYCDVLLSTTDLPSWRNLVDACFSQSSMSLTDLSELTRKPKPWSGRRRLEGDLGYLVPSSFTVRRISPTGVTIVVERHTVGLHNWNSNTTGKWEAELQSSARGQSPYRWQLSGKFLGDPCDVILRGAE